MYKQILLPLIGFFFTVSSLTAQDSYKSSATIRWYAKAVQAFENHHYYLAKEYLEKINLEDSTPQEGIAIQKYQLLTALELHLKNAGTATEDYLKAHPNTVHKTVLVLALANYYFANKQDAKALQWFQQIDVKALTKEQEINYNYKLAFANYKTKNYTKAKAYLLPLAAKGNYQKEAHYYLGNIALQNKNYQDAQYHFYQIKEDKRYYREASYQLLVVLYQQKKYKDVVRLGKTYYMQTKGIEQSEVAKILGESYFYLSDYPKAILYLNKYKGRQRVLTAVDYYFLGFAYYQTKAYAKAIENFNKITDEKSGVSQNAHYHLGDCYLKMHQKSQALNAFKNASEMDFDAEVQQDAFLNYAKLSYEIGNPYQSSSEVLQAFVDAYPNAEQTPMVEGLIVNAYLQYKDYEGALNYYAKQRLVKDATYHQILLEKGLELYQDNQWLKALDYFSKAAATFQDKNITQRAIFWKAETLLEIQKFKEATYYYQSFVNKTSNQNLEEYPNGLYGLAYGFFHQKKYTTALLYFKKYEELVTTDTVKKRNAQLRIADCYFVTKAYWSALENYNKVIKSDAYLVDYARYQKALAYGFLGKNEQKKEVLLSITTQFPNSAYIDNVYYQLGNLYVNQNNFTQAITAYDTLLKKYPKSPLAAKAKLKKGIVLFNTNKNLASVAVLKELVASYPGTGEAVQAVKMAEQVYKEMDRVDLYATWVKKLEFVNITDQEIDKSMFEAAENKYLENDVKSAITSLKKYLINFPKGIYALTAHFYLAQAYFNSNNKDKAAEEYQQVLRFNTNEYTEVTLNKLSQIYLEQQKWEEASVLLLQIENQINNTQSIVYAQSNLMKYYYQKQQFSKALDYTQKVLQNSKSSEQAIADAYVYGARSAMELVNLQKATSYYQKLETIGKGSVQAEANYYKAYFLHQNKAYQKSNEQIQLLASKYQRYKYWGVKGLLLMAQNFHALEDHFQANFILNNIINNVKEHQELVKEATELLQKYQSQASSSESTKTINNATN